MESNAAGNELQNVTVLMVEDDEFFSDIISTKLQQHGCTPTTTSEGDKAISIAVKLQPDIILLDVGLPHVSGYDILKELKQHDTLQHVPVIVFSNYSETESVEASLEAGAAEYLVKANTDFTTLVDIICGNIRKAKQCE